MKNWLRKLLIFVVIAFKGEYSDHYNAKFSKLLIIFKIKFKISVSECWGLSTDSLSLELVLLRDSVHRLSSLLISSLYFLTHLFPCLAAVLADLNLSHLLSGSFDLISFFLAEKKEGRSVSSFGLNFTCSQYL